MELFTGVARQYEDFAAHAQDSPCFSDWATRVAHDAELQEWVASLPAIKQQPNLVFAAARWHGVPAPGPYESLREALLNDDGSIVATILRRSTQTNEVGRLATLAPVFARIAAETDRPLALVEAGASAGLCLYPDRYTYRYLLDTGEDVSWTPGAPGPELACRVRTSTSDPFVPPTGGLDVGLRLGLDLSPVDVADLDATAWLEMLVWPEQDDRRGRLRAAIDIARAEPPRLQAGDIRTDLPAAVEAADAYGEVVVFHSAVVAYLEPEDRRRFAATMAGLVSAGACRWVSNEGKDVLPEVTRTGPDVPPNHPTFVLGLDGRAVAWTHGHGRSMRLLPRR